MNLIQIPHGNRNIKLTVNICQENESIECPTNFTLHPRINTGGR